MSGQPKVVLLDTHFDSPDTTAEIERAAVERAGGQLIELDVQNQEEVIAAVAEATVVLFRSIWMTREIFAAMKCCRGIVRYGIGLDRVDQEAARDFGIEVHNIPDFCVEEMADHTLALLLSAARQLFYYERRGRQGVGGVDLSQPIQRLSELTFGTFGLGRIAQAVHRRVSGFGMKQIAFDPFISEDRWPLRDVESVDRTTLLGQSNILSLHCPATEENKQMINRDVLTAMPARAILVNTARGELVDTAALKIALDEGKIAAAATDVVTPEPLPKDHPIWECSGFIHTPHVGWYSEGSRRELQEKAGAKAAELLTNSTTA